VDHKVMDEAAIEPEMEEEMVENEVKSDSEDSKADESTPKKRNLKDGRLSVFEDYLKKRKGGKEPGTDEPPKNGDPNDKPKPTNN
jgi:hypothetical protein